MGLRRSLLLTFCFIALGIEADGQVIDTSRTRVWYDVTFKSKNEDKEVTKNQEILDIGDKYSYYYNYQTKLEIDYRDSIERVDPTRDSIDIATDPRMLLGGRATRVFKNLNADSLIVTDVLFSTGFKYFQTCSGLDWKLEEGDTIIHSMNCNKASLDLHGRHWEVWYTTEIPIQDGPGKLCGLPGLILKATESEGIFSFSFTGIEKVNEPIFYNGKKKLKVTPKKFQEEFWHNQFEFIIKRNNIPLPPRVWSNQKAYTPCLMEYF